MHKTCYQTITIFMTIFLYHCLDNRPPSDLQISTKLLSTSQMQTALEWKTHLVVIPIVSELERVSLGIFWGEVLLTNHEPTAVLVARLKGCWLTNLFPDQTTSVPSWYFSMSNGLIFLDGSHMLSWTSAHFVHISENECNERKCNETLHFWTRLLQFQHDIPICLMLWYF